MGINLKTAKNWVMMKINITIVFVVPTSYSLFHLNWVWYQEYLSSILTDFLNFDRKMMPILPI